MRGDNTFKSNFSDPPGDEMTPLQYFKLFVTDDVIQTVVDQTNLYTVQRLENQLTQILLKLCHLWNENNDEYC